MKHKHTLVVILLIFLISSAFLLLFSRNSFLRPYAGSEYIEIVAGMLLLFTIYTNYYILYPKLFQQHKPIKYWVITIILVLVSSILEMMVVYGGISQHSAHLIGNIGYFDFILTCFILVVGRNFALNILPFVIRNMQQLKNEANVKAQVVYQETRMLDVCDKQHNCFLLPIDEVFYLKKDGNYTRIYTLKGDFFTRYCSLKYLDQLLGYKDFVRISSSVIVPFKYIDSCDGKLVVMKKMTWAEKPYIFNLDVKKKQKIAAVIDEHFRSNYEEVDNEQHDNEKKVKTLSTPPQKKINTVFDYIKEHSGCRTTEIISHTSYSSSTVERCLAELRKQGFIQYVGSKKTGGYRVVEKE